jgi:hypothetical protein
LLATRAVFNWKLLFISLLTIVLASQSLPAQGGVDFGVGDDSTSGYRFKRGESCIMRRINNIRGRHGLNRLRVDKQLGYVARRHANDLASAGGVWHDDVGSKVTRWRRIGQNTGRGRSCRSLTRAFMRSSTHRAHILGHFRYMGIGTEKRGGSLYVQELFESRRDPGNIWHYP